MKYVLGEVGARKFKELTQKSSGHSSRIANQPQHAIDNYYPHPFEIRWSESQISGGGGYMVWLPDNCLQLNGWNIPPKKWLNNVKDAKINDNLSTDYWYNLGEIIPCNQLSSYDVFLNTLGGEVMFSLSANNKWPGIPGFVHIASIDNYRPKPNVKSNLILNEKLSPFNLVEDPTYDSEYSHIFHQWIMQYQMFEPDGNVVFLPECVIPAPSSIDDMRIKVVRLVKLADGNWCIDRKEVQGSSDVGAMSSKSLGQILTPQVQAEGEATEVYPLYLMTAANGVYLDLREAWYIIGNGSNVDERTIALSSDTSNWKNDETLSSLIGKQHFYHYYDHDRDIEMMQSDIDKREWSFPIRYEKYGDNPVSAEPLQYLRMDALVNYLSVGGGGGGDYPPWNEMSSGMLSNLQVDDNSISKGADGWPSLSGDAGIVHIQHWHDHSADIPWPADPSIAWITTKIYPDSAGSDGMNIAYVSLANFVDKNGKLGPALADSVDAAISAQLSGFASDSGMFKWDISSTTMGPGGVMVGRQWVTASGTGQKSDGLYQVCVTINANGAYSATVVSNASLGQAPTTTQCWIPIYQISGGKIASDYRGAFVVPAFD